MKVSKRFQRLLILITFLFSVLIINIVFEHTVLAANEFKVTFHGTEDMTDETKPTPNPQLVPYNELAKDPYKNTDPNNGKPYGGKYGKPIDNRTHPYSGTNDLNSEKRVPDNIFEGWYTEPELNNKYNFDEPVTSDVNLYPKWVVQPKPLSRKKAFDRDTLFSETSNNGQLPGNRNEVRRVGDEFSYMIHLPKSEENDYLIKYMYDSLPDEISKPTKIEILETVVVNNSSNVQDFTVDLSKTKIKELPHKDQANSNEDYYEWVDSNPFGDGKPGRVLKITLSKDRIITKTNGIGIVFDTKLEKTTSNQLVQNGFLSEGNISYVGGGTMFLLSSNTVKIPWKVEFEPNGGTPKPLDQYVLDKDKATEPTGNEKPTKSNQNFEGWYEDKELTKKFDFSTPIEKDWILYAKWTNFPTFSLEKKVNKSEFKVGETASYELTMTDTENSDLLNPYLKDNLPSGMSEPKNIKLDGIIISKGDSNSQKPYYTWDDSNKRLDVYYDRLKLGETKKITYDSDILSGKAKEVKKNTAILTGSNTTENVEATAEFIIMEQYVLLHVKQEVIDKHDEIVVPKTGFLSFDNVKAGTPSDKKNQLSLVIPSYEADTKKEYKDVKLKWSEEYNGFTPNIKIPEFYKYDAYQLTTNNGNHESSQKIDGKIPTIDASKYPEYWLTIYIKPNTTEDGPSFYNWDYKENNFNKIK